MITVIKAIRFTRAPLRIDATAVKNCDNGLVI